MTIAAELRPHNRSNPTLPLVLLSALCVIAVPLFVRMPLTNDAEQYDLQADVVRRGGVLYRDALEPNLPGVVWVHVGVRRLLGESSEALKAFDLVNGFEQLHEGGLAVDLWKFVATVKIYDLPQ